MKLRTHNYYNMEKEIQTEQSFPYGGRRVERDNSKGGRHAQINRNLMEFASMETGRHYSDHENRI